AASRAVAGAVGARAVRLPAHRDALACLAGHVAGLALAGAGAVAADAVGAAVVGALVRRAAGEAVGLLRHALARGVAVVAGDAVGICAAARLAGGGVADVRIAAR